MSCNQSKYDDARIWSRDETNSLLKMVESLPQLWNHNHPGYKIRSQKEAAKAQLAAMFSTSVHEIKRKLHNIRTQLNHELRKFNHKSQRKISWEFFNAAKFILSESKADQLNEILKKQPNTIAPKSWGATSKESSSQKNLAPDNGACGTNQSHGSEGWFDEPHENINDSSGSSIQFQTDLIDDTLKSDNSENPERPEQKHVVSALVPEVQYFDESAGGYSHPVNTNQVVEPRKCKRKRNNQLLEKALEIMDRPEDDYQHFGNYVASSMRNLRSELRQRQMRRKIQTIILEMEELDEFDQMQRNSNMQ